MDLSLLKSPGIKITPQALLSGITTFKLGGPCHTLVECAHAAALVHVITTLRQQKTSFILMGFGSNILASDKGVNVVIVRYSTSISIVERSVNTLTVDAATQLDDLILYSIEHGLDGLVPLSGIPGTVGGAIAGNAGAHGIDISTVLSTVTLLKETGEIVTVPKGTLGFSYRDSGIKHGKDIILGASFDLAPGKDPLVMKKTHDNIIATRLEKHGGWEKFPSAGSFFRNVLPSSKAGRRESAGWFLEQAGAKDMVAGKAHAYAKHANIITRDEGATAQDVYELTLRMAEAVKQKYGFDLIREVRLLGPFDHAPESNATGYW